MKHRNGEALTKEETVAMQMIAGNDADSAWASDDPTRIRNAIEQVMAYRDVRAEQGRTLAMGRDPMLSDPSGYRKAAMATLLFSPGRTLDQEYRDTMRLIEKAETAQRRRELEEVRQGVIERIAAESVRIRKNLAKIGYTPDALTPSLLADPVTAANIIRAVSTAKADFWDKALELRLALILSGPLTHSRNIAGNVLFGGLELTIMRAIEQQFNRVFKAEGAPTPGEFRYMLRTFLPSLVQAGKNLTLAMRTEQPQFASDLVRSSEKNTKLDQYGPAVGGVLGRAVRFPSLTLLLGADEAAKSVVGNAVASAYAFGIAKREGLSGQAMEQRISDLLADPLSDAWVEALNEGRRLTFQEGNSLSRQLNGLMQLMPKPLETIVRMTIAPFIKTPLNIFRAGLAKTPLVNLPVGIKLSSTALHWASGTPNRLSYKVNRRQLPRDAANVLVGNTIGLYLAHELISLLAPEGDDDELPRITGSAPSDWTARSAAYRTAPPMSVRIGDEWFSYRHLEPLAVSFATSVDSAMAAAEANRAGDTSGAAEAVGRLLSSIIDQTRDKTFLSGLSDLIDVAKNTDSADAFVADWSANFAVGWVPNMIRQPLRQADPNLRATTMFERDEGWWPAVKDTVAYSAFPAEANAPLPRHDQWGREITRSGGGRQLGDIAYRLLVPVNRYRDELSPVDAMLRAYNIRYRAGEIQDPESREWWPRPPQRTVVSRGERIRLTPDEYETIVRDGGRAAHERLVRMVENGGINRSEPTWRDIEQVKKVLSSSYRQVRNRVLAERRRAEIE
jgi:hypothetical protein